MSILTYSYTDPLGNEFVTTQECKYDIDLSIVLKDPEPELDDTNDLTEDEDPEDLTDDTVDEDDDNDCQLGNIEDDIEFPEVDDSIDNGTETPPVATDPSVSPTIKYAPVVAPVKGNYNLYCIALVWNDNKGANINKVTNAGNATAKIYKNLSNGNFNLNVIVKSVKVNFNRNAKNLPAAEKQAKKAAVAGQKNKNPNLFVIVNNGAKGFSNGGGNTAHLLGTLTRDFLHEIGHCKPLQLHHSGRINSDGKYQAYGDGTSFMSSFSSLELTAVQRYNLGWFNEKEVALHEFAFPPVEYKIEKLSSPNNNNDAVKAVMIPIDGQKPIFLSMPNVNGKPTLTLHQPYNNKGPVGSGSRRLLVFGKAASYANLSFQKVSETKDFTVVRIGPVAPVPDTSSAPKPAPHP